MREIHLEERPRTFKQVVGQRTACNQLTGLGKSAEGLPHCLLFTGPSGCGKTTLARIVRRKLKCSDADFQEVNAAENRGIDMVRGIQNKVGLSPIDGEARVWLIDECHQLTGEAQGAFLKLLEEPPDHVYFMLATTNPEKLRKAIITRCTKITVRLLTNPETVGMVQRIAEERETPLADNVAEKLAEVSEGSARRALVLLAQTLGIEDEAKQLSALQNEDANVAGFAIAKALMSRAKWGTLAALIKACTDEPETIRWIIMGYFTTVALGGGKNAERAVALIEEFQDNYYDSKKAGLVVSCYNACNL